MRRRLLTTILAVTALSVTALVGAAPATAADPPPPGVAYVAIGDSVASGNGILPYIKDDEPQCLRSTRSYPMLLAKSMGVSIATEACSGEGTSAIAGQLQELVAANAFGTSTRLVTVTVGVNDVQWQGGAWPQALIACSSASFVPPGSCQGALYLSLLSLNPPPESGLPTLSQRIAMVIGAVRQLAPLAQIEITGYPVLFGQFAGTCNVGLLNVPEAGIREPISYGAAEAQGINQAVMAANAMIAQGVALSGDPHAEYVDVNLVPPGVEGFAGHGLCDSGDAWISGLFPATAKPRDRGFHPNPAGQRAYASIVAAALAG